MNRKLNLNSRWLVMVLVLLTASLLLAACGGDSGEAIDEDTDTEEVEPADSEELDESEETETGSDEEVVTASVPFNNTGEQDICELYLSPVGMEDWGPDQLGGEILPGGGSYLLTDIPVGDYDVLAIGCGDGAEVYGQITISAP